ncbi:MAG: ABC transporter permease [Planctomycetota bacterium]
MKYLVLFKTIFINQWLYLKRYPINLLMSVISMYLFFLVIFIGYKSMAAPGPGYGTTLDEIIVGFMLWLLTIMAVSELAWGLMDDAKTGILEQLYLTPLGFTMVCIFRVISAFLLNLLLIIPIIFLMMVTTGRYLHLDMVSIIPLIILSISSMLSIGFMMGGLTLIFKQLQSVSSILEFAILAFIAVPIEQIPLFKILPLSLGSHLLRKVMVEKVFILDLPTTDLVILIINSSCYLLAGFWVFSLSQQIARKKGTFGHY